MLLKSSSALARSLRRTPPSHPVVVAQAPCLRQGLPRLPANVPGVTPSGTWLDSGNTPAPWAPVLVRWDVRCRSTPPPGIECRHVRSEVHRPTLAGCRRPALDHVPGVVRPGAVDFQPVRALLPPCASAVRGAVLCPLDRGLARPEAAPAHDARVPGRAGLPLRRLPRVRHAGRTARPTGRRTLETAARV